jgi:pimeloyl-ACP methyl ester carboxylesterase
MTHTRLTVDVMDYGAPVGDRLAVKHPERVSALIVQNRNACDEGLKAMSRHADETPLLRRCLHAGGIYGCSIPAIGLTSRRGWA